MYSTVPRIGFDVFASQAHAFVTNANPTLPAICNVVCNISSRSTWLQIHTESRVEHLKQHSGANWLPVAAAVAGSESEPQVSPWTHTRCQRVSQKIWGCDVPCNLKRTLDFVWRTSCSPLSWEQNLTKQQYWKQFHFHKKRCYLASNSLDPGFWVPVKDIFADFWCRV